MTSTTLVLPAWIAREIAAATAGVLLAGLASTGGECRLLGRELLWVPDDSYDRRTPRSLLIRSTGYVAALARAEELGAVPIWLHTHPGDNGVPRPSEHDAVVDEQLRGPSRVRSGADVYASLIASPSRQFFRFSGRMTVVRGRSVASS